jgi:UDP-N-acetylmuramate--alanine ligase
MRVPGFHNIENALAASAVALYLGLSEQKIREGLESYKGVKRRFEYMLDTDRCVFIDDYAHHPTEITAFLNSVRSLYPNKPITAIFQPHLFTRTRDFADGFAESLSLADRVYLLDIYPARELPIEGVTSDMLLANISISDKRLVSKEALLDYFDQTTEGVVVTIGAGDIDRLVAPLLERLTGR